MNDLLIRAFVKKIKHDNMRNIKVGQQFRTNPLSNIPGGMLVEVEKTLSDGKIGKVTYDNVKTKKYLDKVLENPETIRAWVNGELIFQRD